MADGYLDLLGNSLLDTVIHSFLDEAELTAHPGLGEGQIASADGTFWIWTEKDSPGAPRWVRISTAAGAGTVSTFITQITYAPGGATFAVDHGFTGHPEIQVVDSSGKPLEMEIQHGMGTSLLTWEVALSVPVTVTATGTVAS